MLVGGGEAMLALAAALAVMGMIAALGGAASFFGLQGKWRRHEPEPGQVS